MQGGAGSYGRSGLEDGRIPAPSSVGWCGPSANIQDWSLYKQIPYCLFPCSSTEINCCL